MFNKKKIEKLEYTNVTLRTSYEIAHIANIQYKVLFELSSIKEPTVEKLLKYIEEVARSNSEQARIFYNEARKSMP